MSYKALFPVRVDKRVGKPKSEMILFLEKKPLTRHFDCVVIQVSFLKEDVS